MTLQAIVIASNDYKLTKQTKFTKCWWSAALNKKYIGSKDALIFSILFSINRQNRIISIHICVHISQRENLQS